MLSTLVVVPTYNERASLAGVVRRLLDVDADVAVLVVDDGSPDGTGHLADSLAAANPRVSVLHRPAKSGLGTAYLAGFQIAQQHGYEIVVEFDADGSHQPEELPALLAAVEAGADLAIGTRWMPGGRVENWALHRKLISRAGTRYARIMLGSHLHDITSGFRAFRTSVVAGLDLASANSHGYCFQIELAWLVERSGSRITEVPITFIERTTGSSKMSFGIVVEAMWRVTVWGITRTRIRVSRAAPTPGVRVPGAPGRDATH
jgi:dolichol-phosphate mannosyltransferase